MENKIKKIKDIRKNIINDYSSKEITRTSIENIANDANNEFEVRVKEIIKETDDVKSFILVPPKGSILPTFKSGMYISLKLEIDGMPTTRAYSLSSSPFDTFYRITIKRVEDGLVSNYMLDNISVGDTLVINKPVGDFYYSEIRDEENIIAIAGGSGITPFMSLAKYIEESDSKVNLTIIYSVKTENDIIFKKEIEEINKKSKKVKFVITLSREEKDGYLNGHINKEMLSPYMKEFNTIFMCGPKSLYKAMNETLIDFNIPRKNVHYENFYNEYIPKEVKSYKLRILSKGKAIVVDIKSDETLLTSMEKAGIKAPSLCRVGECGFCRSILIDGKVKMIGAIQSKALADNDYIHPCVCYPESDVVIRLDI